MSTKEKKAVGRLRGAVAAATLIALGSLSVGCAPHTTSAAGAPTAPDDRPTDQPAGQTGAAAAPAPSPLSKGDQDEMKQKQDEMKGQAPPP